MVEGVARVRGKGWRRHGGRRGACCGRGGDGHLRRCGRRRFAGGCGGSLAAGFLISRSGARASVAVAGRRRSGRRLAPAATALAAHGAWLAPAAGRSAAGRRDIGADEGGDGPQNHRHRDDHRHQDDDPLQDRRVKPNMVVVLTHHIRLDLFPGGGRLVSSQNCRPSSVSPQQFSAIAVRNRSARRRRRHA